MLKISERTVEFDIAAMVKPRSPERLGDRTEFAADLERETGLERPLPSQASDAAVRARTAAQDRAAARPNQGRSDAPPRADRSDEVAQGPKPKQDAREPAVVNEASDAGRDSEATEPGTTATQADAPPEGAQSEAATVPFTGTDAAAQSGAASDPAVTLALLLAAQTGSAETPAAETPTEAVLPALPMSEGASQSGTSVAPEVEPAAGTPAAMLASAVAISASTGSALGSTNTDTAAAPLLGRTGTAAGLAVALPAPAADGKAAEAAASDLPDAAIGAGAEAGDAVDDIVEADRGPDTTPATSPAAAKANAADKLAALEPPGLARGLDTAISAKTSDGSIVLPTPAEGARAHGGTAAAHGTATAAGQTPVREAVPIERVAIEMAAAARAGTREIEIRLDPAELGRIDVTLEVDDAGKVTTRLVVEKSETLDQLRRDAPSLEKALNDAGLKTDSGSLQFSLRDQGRDGQGGDQERGARSRGAQVTLDIEEINGWRSSDRARAAALRGGIDVRI